MSEVNHTAVRRLLAVALGATVVLLIALAVLIGRQLGVEALPPLTAQPAPDDPALVARGAYLARAGNCAACHTARGGPPYAGGRGIETPFGTVFAGNLTPDTTGLGAWSADAFWRAMQQGVSRDGRLLYPAFPYESFSRITRDDSDALHAFLRSLTPVAQANRPHALRFPYSTQAALAVWRELYFEPAAFQPDTSQSAEWDRGAYLVQGLGHCSACHSPRDALGGVDSARALDGGLMPGRGWYAPSLRAAHEAGPSVTPGASTVELLKTGVTAGASAMGPMAEVVQHSTQHLSDADLNAIGHYLASQALPAAPPPAAPSAPSAQLDLGEKVYKQHCLDCHGEQGQGAAREGLAGTGSTMAYPPLAGNRAVRLASPVNAVQAILGGGFAPATAGHPQPYGMPPFRTLLNDTQIAAVTSFIRQRWGNQAGAVTPLDVQGIR
ncbi:c-type cytochrome [Hydrogenophaga sp. A37]|uniref:c-type cytochrome n=1 Tax=Hydrogenophaga sp. A37 TaxID=1945864 RepID=UPI0009851D90|nr:cytochrome c [Hydrogenophaga sp. A37]OOG85877.1 alcohol dehydrogenase [Hydrogenophaga sp. A37]